MWHRLGAGCHWGQCADNDQPQNCGEVSHDACPPSWRRPCAGTWNYSAALTMKQQIRVNLAMQNRQQLRGNSRAPCSSSRRWPLQIGLAIRWLLAEQAPTSPGRRLPSPSGRYRLLLPRRPKLHQSVSTSGRLAISRLPAPLNPSIQAMSLCSTSATGLLKEWCRPNG